MEYNYQCQECNNEYYCQQCNSVRFRNKFANWTSGDSNLNELIQNSQLNAERSLHK
jgi:hypothetical protein